MTLGTAAPLRHTYAPSRHTHRGLNNLAQFRSEQPSTPGHSQHSCPIYFTDRLTDHAVTEHRAADHNDQPHFTRSQVSDQSHKLVTNHRIAVSTQYVQLLHFDEIATLYTLHDISVDRSGKKKSNYRRLQYFI